MTFKDLLDQLKTFTPEQLKQEVMFVKYGAGSDYNWNGLAVDGYSENSDRVKLMEEPDGVWYVENEFSGGIADGLTAEERANYGEMEQIVPPNMPFFGILEN